LKTKKFSKKPLVVTDNIKGKFHKENLWLSLYSMKQAGRQSLQYKLKNPQT